MRNGFLRAALAAALLLVVPASVVAADSAPDDPVATVDGQAITKQDFDHWLAVAAKSTHSVAVPDPATGYRRCIAAMRKTTPPENGRKVTNARLKALCKREYAQLRPQVLQLLISFKWIEGEAAAQNITATDAEVAQAFEEQKQQSFPKQADFKRFLEQSGQTEEDILARVRLDLLSNKIRDKVVAGHDQVSDQAIEQFYAEHRSRFAEPEKRALRIVLTRSKAEGQRARSALERGASWKAVARRYSIDSESKRRGGKLPAQAKGTLDRRLDKAVFNAGKRRLVGPIRTDYGYYVFTVTKVKPARQPPLAEVRETIQQTLASEAQQAALDTFVQEFTARWRARTECAKGYRTTDCRNGPAPTPVPTVSENTSAR